MNKKTNKKCSTVRDWGHALLNERRFTPNRAWLLLFRLSPSVLGPLKQVAFEKKTLYEYAILKNEQVRR